MATLVASTVDTGGTGDYTSLNAAETANFGATSNDLEGNDEYCECTCICTDGAADTKSLWISGQLTDSTRYIQIETGASYRHAGTYPSSGNVYRLEVTGNCVWTDVGFTKFIGLAIEITPSANSQRAVNISGSVGDTYTVSHCVIKSGTPGAYTGTVGLTWYQNVAYTVYVDNNMVYDFVNATCRGIYHVSSAATSYVYNTTIVGCNYGIITLANTCVVKNMISFDSNTADYSGTFSGNSTHNGYTTGQSGPTGGSSAIDLGSAASAVFRDEANDDYRIYDTSTAYQVGTDLSGDANLAITDDIEGDARAATPSIGADEGTAAPGTQIKATQREQFQSRVSRWALEALKSPDTYHP